jgi:hypothetical protein
MRPILKNIAILIVIILIASSATVALLAEPRCAEKPSIDRYQGPKGEDVEEEDNETDDGNDNGNTEKFPWDSTHFVFIEEATGKDCVPCVAIGKLLHDLYEEGKYPFYYISLIGDLDNTKEYLKEKYNNFAYPSVYIDGGYKTLFGGATEKSTMVKNIKAAMSRDFSSVYIDVDAKWDENNSEITIEGVIKNDGDSTYKGYLRIYLAEIITQDLVDASKKPYHFGSHSFITDKSVDIPSKDILNFSKTINSSELDPENLMIYAAIFNSKEVVRYSDPDDLNLDGDKHEFKANFADNVAGTEVVEGGNLPPYVGITLPESGKLHISSKPIFKFILLLNKKTVMIGRIDIKVDVEDETGIERVDFYLDDNLLFSDDEEPYEYSIDKSGSFRKVFRKHKIKVTAIDKEEKENSAEIEVFTLFF